jgi:hypothetical protein
MNVGPIALDGGELRLSCALLAFLRAALANPGTREDLPSVPCGAS